MLTGPRLLASLSGFRLFGTSTAVLRHVSHIGAVPIKYPSNVSFNPTPTALEIKGPLGETAVPLRPYMSITQPKPEMIGVVVEDPEVKEQKQMWGTTRTLVSNAIIGMSQGFSVNVYLVGVGYRVAIEMDPRGTSEGNSGSRLNMKIGYSHVVFVPIPPHIKAEVPMPTKIVLSCTDKQKLGLFAAQIKARRKPDVYKGKGIFIGDEKIRMKSVKKK